MSGARAYGGVDDLRRMQAAVAAAFASTSLRVGDLAWLRRSHTHRELSLDIHLWDGEDGGLAGFTFFRANGGFIVFVAPGRAEAALLDEMLGVVDHAAGVAVAAGDPPVALYTYGIDVSRSVQDRLLAAALERHGYAAAAGAGGLLRRRLEALPEPRVAAGYGLRSVESADVAGRVEAHRAAFAPSSLTRETYERVRATWPYRGALDRIAVTDDGTVVAFCTAWLDEENGAGLLEPVGTHPAHQRRGLATAVCLDALAALRDAGARIAEVGYDSDGGLATYRGMGFEPGATDTVFRRPSRLMRVG